ncbi:MAG TPA: M1 family aminopeptidase [Solirubrobacterales bacterium]|nr:M1 family aminopeptidase [Solirubrobacterales bacterium]
MRRYAGIVIALIAALAIIVPTALAQSDAPAQTAPVASAAADTDGPLLAVTSVSSAPAGASAGDSFELSGTVANSGAEDGDGEIVVNLLLGGHQPLAVGRTSVEVAAGESKAYGTEVSVPAGIADGSYSLVACIQRADVKGELGCATAVQRLVVGQADAVRGPAVRAAMARRVDPDPTCTPGARSLSEPGEHLYPDQGNGGYTSLHTSVNLVFDGDQTVFLPGTNVVLTDRAEECLSELSLDFARETAGDPGAAQPGADMEVEKVFVNGEEAEFKFAQPTFPGNPNGPDDPDPLAHQSGQDTPVSATNPNPPACSPVGEGDAAVGQPCAANKLVITPDAPLQAGETFDVKVEYSGRPGVFTDGDGSVEGWFRSTTPAGIDSIVVTEPVGGLAWMPLNNHPTAKPTYDFTEKVSSGMTAIANGELVSVKQNLPDAAFPTGSTTWRWHSPEPVASYLVASSIVNFDLSQRIGDDGTIYHTAETPLATPAQAALNQGIIATHEEVTAFQERFSGPYPFTANGIVVGINRTFAEEMQTKIAINNGRVRRGTFHHENFHQWWGDNVSESSYNETFFKEGLAELSGNFLIALEEAEDAGGLDTPAGDAAFEGSLVEQFEETYELEGNGEIDWTSAPSDPTPETLFANGSTYERTALSYIALREILGHDNFSDALKKIQRDFGGGTIEESEVKTQFAAFLPNQSPACLDRLDTFFTEWWDTEFAAPGSDPTTTKPQLTAPGLVASASGKTFFDANGGCQQSAPTTTAALSPDPVNGRFTDPTVTLTAVPGTSGAKVTATTVAVDGGAERAYTGPFTLTGTGSHTVAFFSTDAQGDIEQKRSIEVLVNDAPVTTATLLPAPVNGVSTVPVGVALTATDDAAGVASTEYRIDGGGFQAYAGPFTVSALGNHTVEYRSTDRDGAIETAKQVSFTIAAAPIAKAKEPVCAKPQLAMAVKKPLRTKKGVVTLRKGKAYRYTGSLTCEVDGKRAPAPEGTAISISTVKGGKTTRQPGVAVGADGKIETLLQYAGKRTIVFGFAAAEARVRIVTARR